MSPEGLRPGCQHILDSLLRLHVKRQDKRFVMPGRITELLVVLQFNARRADDLGPVGILSANAIPTQNMRSQAAVRIEPGLAATKFQSRLTDLHNGLVLVRRQTIGKPDKGCGTGQLLEGRVPVQPRYDPCQGLGHAHGRHARLDIVWTSIERPAGHVRFQTPVLAINDIGDAGADLVIVSANSRGGAH